MWRDPWYGMSLKDRLSLNDSDLKGCRHKLRELTDGNNWVLGPHIVSIINLVGINIQQLPRLSDKVDDRMVWKHNGEGTYIVTKGVEQLRIKNVEPWWAKILWKRVVQDWQEWPGKSVKKGCHLTMRCRKGLCIWRLDVTCVRKKVKTLIISYGGALLPKRCGDGWLGSLKFNMTLKDYNKLLAK
ncbi:hypothetical protein FRX31_019378 [Thalictrum thalictroides]|uniref:Uncharacterized protein n=1 Tax=Thalictrum thalictroides TaxID=46969 RepID=A0A7J6W3E0_THATH|nr:hypothetical protein FRX31_019378 [Thalictrum thalictroides]